MAIHKYTKFTAGLCVLLLSMSACRDQSTESDRTKAALDCMKRQPEADDYVLETKCSTLSQQKNFEGTWFVGLEVSAFRSGYVAEPAELGNGSDLVELIAPTGVSASVRKKDAGSLTAYRIAFAGRESSTPGDADRKVVVLDRITKIQKVELR